MEPEHARIAYEQIDNQILRLLLYFGGVVILALSSTLAYLWHAWRAEQRDRIELDRLNASALTSVANELDNLRERIDALERTVAEKLSRHAK